MFNKGSYLNYYGQMSEVVDSNNTHVLIMFNNGSKICTNKNTFKK